MCVCRLHLAADGVQSDIPAAQEVSILKSLNYDKNIVQFYGACMRPGQDLMLVTEVQTDRAASGLTADCRAVTETLNGHCTGHMS